jgi:hypothetical protein
MRHYQNQAAFIRSCVQNRRGNPVLFRLMLFASDNVFAKAQAIVKVKCPNSVQDARQTAGYLFLNEYF